MMAARFTPAKTPTFIRTYENIIGTAYTHTGTLIRCTPLDTLDPVAAPSRGWDVFEDNNNGRAFTTRLLDLKDSGPTGTPPSRRVQSSSRTTTTIDGGPQLFDLTLAATTSGKSPPAACRVEENRHTDPVTGLTRQAEWYDASIHLFYTVDPRLISPCVPSGFATTTA
jgi:hypothetical protein